MKKKINTKDSIKKLHKINKGFSHINVPRLKLQILFTFMDYF